MIIVVINSDGINSQGQNDPDIYRSLGTSARAQVIALGYEHLVHYQSLRDGSLIDEPLRLKLFEQARAAEADTQPLTQPDIKPQLPPTSASISYSSNSSNSPGRSSTGSSFVETRSELKIGVSDLSALRKSTLSETKDKTVPSSTTRISQFKQKLASLCEDNHYKFTLERLSRNKLLIRVVAETAMWADSGKMKSHLEPAVDLLRKMVMSANITIQQFKIESNLEMG